MDQLDIEGRSAVAIGKFDGIHIGHRALLDRILDKKKEGTQAVIFTFMPSPEEFFSGRTIPAIDTTEEKRERFQQMGVDVLVEYPLTAETAAMEPEEFMEKILWEKLHAGYVVSGKDLSFGNKGRGDVRMLYQFSLEHSFSYEVIDKVSIHDREVSSTAVREAIARGDMESALEMLGRAYQIGGKVEHGMALGRKISVPTVNILPQNQKLLPPNGVYATVSQWEQRFFYGITNLGYKPTVSSEKKIGAETHLFDFEEEIYGERITTWFLHYIRPEIKFESLEALAEQIRKDEAAGKAYLAEFSPDLTNIM